jgi:GNAT superfamily N-acetyltransferase
MEALAASTLDQLLENIIWHALDGAQARFSAGTPRGKRYSRGIAALAGFPDPEHPDFDALAPFGDASDRIYCLAWTGKAPPGWRIEADTFVHQYVWDRGMPEVDIPPEATRLGPAHAARMVELAELTKPGPFGPRNLELGEYYGLFEGDRLVAMAGERLKAGRLREVSGVCTHPDFQGRGLARGLMNKVIHRQLARGQIPFLHVMDGNARARELYSRMGFSYRRQLALRVVVPAA